MKNILYFLIILFFYSCGNEDVEEATTTIETTPVENNISIEKPSTDLQSGDLIFQTSQSAQSQAIQLATHSKYSHVGIIYNNKNGIQVYEAVQPVKITPLSEWIDRGLDKHYVVKRLTNANEVLTPDALANMKKIGKKYKGKEYDIYFEWSDDKIYCSELVWKMFKEAVGIEIGKLEKLSSFDLTDESVQKIMKERYGDNIPLDELVISPAAMFNSDQLITVIEK